MKTGTNIFSPLLLALGAVVGSAGLAHGQWLPIKGDGGRVGGVATTNGVTFVEYTWVIAGCDQVSSLGPVIRNGNTFSYDFSIEHNDTPGIACPDFVIREQSNVVLGTLAPGNYTLITTSWNVPIGTNTFTISPTLQPVGRDAEGRFQIQMSYGITNVSYVLQCSSNLVNWVSLSTNSVRTNAIGWPLKDSSPLTPGRRYYRVRCQ